MKSRQANFVNLQLEIILCKESTTCRDNIYMHTAGSIEYL